MVGGGVVREDVEDCRDDISFNVSLSPFSCGSSDRTFRLKTLRTYSSRSLRKEKLMAPALGSQFVGELSQTMVAQSAPFERTIRHLLQNCASSCQ